MIDALVSQLSQLGLLGASILIALLWLLLFYACDSFFPPHTKACLTHRLEHPPATPWSRIVIQFTDWAFVGAKPSYYNRPRFWRVCGFSLGTAAGLFLVLLMSSSAFEATVRDTATGGPASSLVLLFALFLILNPIVDYCSVVETRLVLAWMASLASSWLSVLALIVLDALFTLALVLVLFPVLVRLVLRFVLDDFDLTHGNLSQVVWDGFFLRGDRALFGLYNYTTFFTSIWIWLYVVAEAVFRLLSPLRRWFPITERPFLSVGLVVATLAGIAWFAVGALARFVETATRVWG